MLELHLLMVLFRTNLVSNNRTKALKKHHIQWTYWLGTNSLQLSLNFSFLIGFYRWIKKCISFFYYWNILNSYKGIIFLKSNFFDLFHWIFMYINSTMLSLNINFQYNKCTRNIALSKSFLFLSVMFSWALPVFLSNI